MPKETQDQQEASRQFVSAAASYPLGLVSVYASKEETTPLAQMSLSDLVAMWRAESPRWIEDILAAGENANTYKLRQEVATLNAAFDGSRKAENNRVIHRNEWITLDLDPPHTTKHLSLIHI